MSRTLQDSGTKACARCGATKAVLDYRIHKDTKGRRRHSYCRSCEAQYNRARRARGNGLCEGAGHPGGPAYRKSCEACGLAKSNTAFWRGSAICTKCRNLADRGSRYERKVRREALRQPVEVRHVRLSFAEHMERCNASSADHLLVRRALARYGMSNPCPDDLIEEYVRTHPTKAKASDPRHATVLLANETGNLGRTRRYDPRAA